MKKFFKFLTRKADVATAEPVAQDHTTEPQQPPIENETAPKSNKKTRKKRPYSASSKEIANARPQGKTSSTSEEDTSAESAWKNRKKPKKETPKKQLKLPVSPLQLLTSSIFIYSVMVLVLVVQSLIVVQQSFSYRAEYQQLNQLKDKERKLNTEWGRMLIEKQTFGSSAQIATRATMEMGMFSPSRTQRVALTLPEKAPSQ